MVSSTPSVEHRNPWRWIMNSFPGLTWTGRIWPGSFVANATSP